MSLLWVKRGWLTPGSQTIRALERFGASDVWDFVDNSYVRAGVVTTNAGLTVTRASAGYAENSNGTLVSFASGALRQTDKGVLVEGARTNLIVKSQQFDAAEWVKENLTVTANAITAPDSTLTADKLVENAANDAHLVYQAPARQANNCFTVWLKAAERTFAFVQLADAASTRNRYTVVVDLSTGSVTDTETVGTPTGTSNIVVAYANGWYRVILTLTNSSTDTSQNVMLIGLSNSGTPSYNANGLPIYTGDGTSGVYVWGAQLEVASFASSYIPTEASTVTRAADQITANLSGVAYPASLYAEFVRNGDTGAAEGVFQVDASSRAQRANINVSSSDTLSVTVRGGTNDGDATVTGAITVGAITKGAGRIEANKVQAARAGTLATEDTTASVPTSSPDTARFGDFGATATHGFLYVRRAALFPSALTDAELQGITT